MRRDEFREDNSDEIERLAHRCEVGYLGITDPEGYPRVVPLNFALKNGCIYFHGALEGEKFDAFLTNPKATFCAAIPYSLIPSYWLAKDYACPATAFFKSLYFRGEGSLVDDPDEKAMALQALMEKLQPEGNFRPIVASDPMYEKPLQKVAIFKIVPNRVDTKFKFGQNMGEATRRRLIAKLEERDQGMDKETADEMRKSLGESLRESDLK